VGLSGRVFYGAVRVAVVVTFANGDRTWRRALIVMSNGGTYGMVKLGHLSTCVAEGCVLSCLDVLT
jgi:hypothetical protein